MTRLTDIDNATSYATEANLAKALARVGLDKTFHVVVCNRAGRFTAIFGCHASGFAQSGDITAAARHGFKTID